MSHASHVGSAPASAIENGPQFAAIERAFTRIIGLNEARKPSDASRMLVHPLDRAAYAVLTRIGECDAIRLTELASTMAIDLSTASRQVRALEERGLVARACDPDDQRTRWLSLTDIGRTALADARSLRIEVLQRRLATWNSSDVTELARLLNQLIESFGAARNDERHPMTRRVCELQQVDDDHAQHDAEIAVNEMSK